MANLIVFIANGIVEGTGIQDMETSLMSSSSSQDVDLPDIPPYDFSELFTVDGVQGRTI